MSGIVIDGSLLQRLLARRIYLIDRQRQPCTTQVIEIFVIEQFDIEFFDAFAGTGKNNAVIGQRIGTCVITRLSLSRIWKSTPGTASESGVENSFFGGFITPICVRK